MSIATVKASLKTLLATVNGVNTIYTNVPRNQPDNVLPSILISVDKVLDKKSTYGKRRITYTVTLGVMNIDDNPNEDISQQAYDDLLDAIDLKLLSDYSLGGTVLKSAYDGIDTMKLPPQVPQQDTAAILMMATKTFDVVVEIIG